MVRGTWFYPTDGSFPEQYRGKYFFTDLCGGFIKMMDPTTHEVLLGAPVIILEGLTLGHVAPGAYELLCLPLSLPDLEAAPARAVLRSLEP